jgi:hypothetical protein
MVEERERPKKVHCSTWVFPQREDIEVSGGVRTLKEMHSGVCSTTTKGADIIR